MPQPSRSGVRATALTLAGVLALPLGLAACKDDHPASGAGAKGARQPDLSIARSEPREDSVYPNVGNPLVDALHYDLDLTWAPGNEQLVARETLVFRATADAKRIPLDFSDALRISRLEVDGRRATFRLRGKDLVIDRQVRKDEQHEVEIHYAGRPEPAPAPSTREDFREGTGWHVTDRHETWTMQEPYGAYTWYAVNDQPADKALYDFRLTAPASWHGVANGRLTSSTREGRRRTDRWHLAEPASSYLVTVAFGRYRHTDLKSASGVPIQVWTTAGGDPLPGDTEYAVDAMAWLEKLLGPYPFDTFGVLVVDNDSGMETQTMVTLGNTDYALSADVMVHEMAHHWYGDSVTPGDWSDVWMNEGMAMYLQGMWEAEQADAPVKEVIDSWAGPERQERRTAGPPAAYDRSKFGASNIYYGPAMMWQELREKVGDEKFFEVLRKWPEQHANGTADREEYWSWIERTTGQELTDFFHAWLLDATTPAH